MIEKWNSGDTEKNEIIQILQQVGITLSADATNEELMEVCKKMYEFDYGKEPTSKEIVKEQIF